RYIFMFGMWEVVGTRLVQCLLQPGMSFVDVGANIGYYSLLAARLVGEQGHVLAFEPESSIRERFLRNVRLNQFTNIDVRPEVIAAESGTVSFYPVDQTGNTGLSSMVPGPGRTATPVAYPALTLDAAMYALPPSRAVVLKIDVEGAESQVF